ncbi:MAG: endonuclease/exonuclease/phosphatase family protein [Bacteroidota bacterium]
MSRSLLLIIACFFPVVLFTQSFTVVSWNIQYMGGTKSAEEIHQMAQILRDYDAVAIQEVVAKDPAGARAIARLADELNRMGNRWDYVVSNPTHSSTPQASKRYAYLWKSTQLQMIGRPYLESSLDQACEREPYVAKFRLKSGETFTLMNFHAIPHDDNPRPEIQALLRHLLLGAQPNLVLLGDFNLNHEEEVWQPLYDQLYVAALQRVPTTLKRKCTRRGEYFNHAIDNVYFPLNHFRLRSAGRIDFVESCDQLEAARSLSDHVPVVAELEFWPEK